MHADPTRLPAALLSLASLAAARRPPLTDEIHRTIRLPRRLTHLGVTTFVDP